MAGSGKGVPGDMEPVGAGEELVGEGVGLEEVDKALELSRIFRTDIGSLTDQVLRIPDIAHLGGGGGDGGDDLDKD